MNGNAREDEAAKIKKSKEALVFMWGYLPGASAQRSPILSPVLVRYPVSNLAGESWKDVCGGGCGFATAMSADDLGQSYVPSGKHEETPEPFPLPTEVSIVKAAAGWAHWVSVTDTGEVYAWGWRECVPSRKVIRDLATGGSFEMDTFGKQSSLMTEQVSPRSQGSKSNGGTVSHLNSRKAGEEIVKRIRVSSAKQEPESSRSDDETLSALPCLVNLGPGVRITSVATGGRHTLALSGKSTTFWVTAAHKLKLSDMGQVWGWGYGGEGQLGLGSRIKMMSSPHLIPCIGPSAYGKDRSSVVHQGSMSETAQDFKVPGSYARGIACGGRHSAVITDAGALLTFGWGLYGQCGQGSTNDQLRPICVSSLLGVQVEGIAAGLWHTLCISVEGRVYAFGGNQFGQLGTGADEAETLPRLLDAPSLESKHAKILSCGARHSAILTEGGKVFCWGWDKYGQFGLGDSIDRNIPSQVSIDGCLPKIVACSWWHTRLLAETQSKPQICE